MTRRVKIGLWVGGLLLAASLISNWFGFGMIKEERRLHTETKTTLTTTVTSLSTTAKALTTAKRKLNKKTRYVKAPVIVPDPLRCPTCVRALLDGNGNAIYKETTITEAKEVTEALARSFASAFGTSSSISTTASAIMDDLDLKQRPAVKKWMAASSVQPLKGGRFWLGPGFRQSLTVIEIGASITTPVWPTRDWKASMLNLNVAW